MNAVQLQKLQYHYNPISKIDQAKIEQTLFSQVAQLNRSLANFALILDNLT